MKDIPTIIDKLKASFTAIKRKNKMPGYVARGKDSVWEKAAEVVASYDADPAQWVILTFEQFKPATMVTPEHLLSPRVSSAWDSWKEDLPDLEYQAQQDLNRMVAMFNDRVSRGFNSVQLLLDEDLTFTPLFRFAVSHSKSYDLLAEGFEKEALKYAREHPESLKAIDKLLPDSFKRKV